MKQKTYKTKTLTDIRRRVQDSIAHYSPYDFFTDANEKLFKGFSEILSHERPETQKAVLLLVEGMSRDQVAERLKISRQAVDKKVQRLRPLLAEMLKDVSRERGFTGGFADHAGVAALGHEYKERIRQHKLEWWKRQQAKKA